MPTPDANGGPRNCCCRSIIHLSPSLLSVPLSPSFRVLILAAYPAPQIQLRSLGSTVSSPNRSGQNPATRWNLVNFAVKIKHFRAQISSILNGKICEVLIFSVCHKGLANVYVSVGDASYSCPLWIRHRVIIIIYK